MERTHGEKGKVRYSIGGYVTTQTLHSIAVNRTVAYLYQRPVGPFAGSGTLAVPTQTNVYNGSL
jgi:hypothetical protein